MKKWIISFMLCVSTLSYAQKEKKPNFIIILADDLGYGDVGFNGSKQIKTPEIDALAKQGVQFTQGYVSAPVCGPSRAGLMTGRNQVSFGFDNNPIVDLPQFDHNYIGVPVEETTLADRLAELGYVNGLVGKWHLGEADQFHPLKRGFHEFWGYLGGGHNYFPNKADGSHYPNKIECNYKEPQPITYITDDKGDECVDFIKRHKDEPFFLFASFNAPHAPLQATKEDLALYSHIKERKRRTYAAMIHRLDVNVGRIMKTLKDHKIDDNTVVVFLSDNGGPCDHNASINAPLNGQKGILLEGGIRVPFVISYPKHLKKGTFDQPVTSLDLTPTFVKLAGGEIKKNDKLDGVDIMPYLLKEKEGDPHETMMWRFTISAGIRKGNWKLIRLPDRLPMLFNLDNDISEQHDVSSEHQDLVIEMLKQLGQWDITRPQVLYLEGSRWRKNQVELYDAEYQLEQPEAAKRKSK
ncbi:sulfatase-like hydrolase/transferase [Flammeovirga yaeyamensis]|uniref:Sulfatase-like hydrolase/transferase n=1 Tax=Flammeovirga yaeyamensis TaxID=367791 RepID=A0AAX1NEP3_9BACT|nr:sulfatase [Flammeovirga yaeyamensis]MBB3699856.1 arylsulfatase A-like enzyme [Flammeovirga yaeyamensis]NMF38347.1 sulfatase [Flammeovirga yaeyamensis]QWG04758.1 sulfatase-like hydrolase/transferase [Flammeovirga yaeyamensis]